MATLLESIFAWLLPYLQIALFWAVILIPIAIGAIVGFRVLTTLTLRKMKRWRLKKQWQLKQRPPKELFDDFEALLSLEAITELYAPANRFVEDLEDDKKHGIHAWLSPYKRAVKASAKRNPKAGRGKVFHARKQIAEAGKHITLRPLNDTERMSIMTESDTEHFVITFKLAGEDPQHFKKQQGKISGQIGLKHLTEKETEDAYSVSFIASKVERESILEKHKRGVEFYDEFPAKSPYSLPIAIQENGRPWSLPTHHTLISGTTGSGKGSPIKGAIRQLTPFVENGTVQLYGIDPKRTELLPYEATTIFKEVVYDEDDAIEIINTVHQEMNQRTLSKSREEDELTASKKYPMTVFFIDEFLDLLLDFGDMGKEGKQARTKLTQILAKGRSLGIFVIAATQEPDKNLLERMRGNFANVILLRQSSLYFNDLFLGAGAAEKGYDSTLIAESNKANGYRTSGIGFGKDETGQPARIRFAFISKDDVIDFTKPYLTEEYKALEAVKNPEQETDTDRAEEWGWEPLPTN